MDISSLREPRGGSTMSVSELNQYIKRVFDNDRILNAVSVSGEISNFVNHRSGHLYFSLKDNEGQVRAIMFRSSAARLKFVPENGMKVTVRASVTVYPRDGSYQLYVNSMEPSGVGALYLAYEQLKERLGNEGLFSEEYKRPIPRFPRKIGVITSPTGAAVRDIINVSGRRFPSAKLYLYPSRVQGEGAVEDLIKALDYFDKSNLVDVIIIGRGGGSIEDLWAFNSEELARKIFAHKTPIISAVGHETDFTICDFVADMRAPTPSAAAELSVPDSRELLQYLDTSEQRLTGTLIRYVARLRERLSDLADSEVVKNPMLITKIKREELGDITTSLTNTYKRAMREYSVRLSLNAGRLNALSPLSVLSRGYSILEGEDGIVTEAKSVKIGDDVKIRVKDGSIKATVKEIYS